ncbi:hypothetical protein [Streptomyces sp. TLI_171]|uniref:hypothetical protein n=1 Tax=Streptomyces sp. TLI_171 TaxID=1938859 RepID=UPI000C4342AA|nr:hypothetical protein [Streptomyces sp. TLI_171]RKE05024.1 hypothetical protein BX266_7269 [Streptomyces sp. TLI_171]
MTVTPATERALREAMERLLAGRPERTDGKLTKNNLWREAGLSRATMNRATNLLAEWDSRIAASPAGLAQRRRDEQIIDLTRRLQRSDRERRRLQEQVDAAATVIAALLAENTALREQAANRSAVITPLARV